MANKKSCSKDSQALGTKAATRRVLLKGVLRNLVKFTGKLPYQSLCFNKVAGLRPNFIKIETLPQVFSCEFYEISKNTFHYRTPLVAASVGKRMINAPLFNPEDFLIIFQTLQIMNVVSHNLSGNLFWQNAIYIFVNLDKTLYKFL